MIIGLGGDKGGTGKTTLVTNLATGYLAKGITVGLIACDNNQSLMKWHKRRLAAGQLSNIPFTESYKNIKRDVERMASLVDVVLVDTAGYDNEELRNLALVSDLIIVPIRPSSQSEVDSLEKITKIINTAKKNNPRLRAHILFNRCKPTYHKERIAIKEALESDKNWIQPFKTFITLNQAFENGLNEGRSIYEIRTRTSQPAAQIDLLIQEIGEIK